MTLWHLYDRIKQSEKGCEGKEYISLRVQREDGGANLSGKDKEAVPELWTEQCELSRLQRIPSVTGRRYRSFPYRQSARSSLNLGGNTDSSSP